MINPTFHTPILLVHPPEFTLQDKQMLTQFFFEKLKTPGFALMDSAMSSLWAYGLQTSTIIDVGYEKTDITPIVDFLIQKRARKTVHGAGGEMMTKYLCSLLPDLKPEDVENLKKSNICEILPLGTPLPGSGEEPTHIQGSRADDDEEERLANEEEGTINVAAIVTSGKTREFLEKKEKEKKGIAERRLPNREREMNTFWVIDKKRPGEDEEREKDTQSMQFPPGTASALTSPIVAKAPELPAAGDANQAPAAAANGSAAPPAPIATGEAATAPASSASALTSPVDPKAPQLQPHLTPEDAEKRYKEQERRKQEKRAAAEGIVLREDETWRELTVGTERFRAAECGILQIIADALYASIQTVEDVGKRADLWDSLVVVGNGAKLKGSFIL